MEQAILFFLLGLLIGGAVVALLSRRRETELRAHIAGEIQRALPQVAEAVLTPKAQQLEHAAEQELKLLGADTVNRVELTQAGLVARIEEMQKLVAGYQARLSELDKERAAEQALLQQQLAAIASTGASMAAEARSLRESLATSGGVRGSWGERVLQNILNSCGMNENVDYELQAAAENRLRPDAVVRLPSGRRLAIDAKASLSAFLDGLKADNAAAQRAEFARFAQVLRGRAKELAGKEYSRNLADSLPCVVMFVPSEGAFRAALDADPDLFLYGQQLQPAVLIASPSTLFPMVSVIAHGWQQHQATRQMRELTEQIQQLGQRLQPFLRHVQAIGKGVDAAGKAYNAALASFQSRVSPQWNKVRDLGAAWDEAEELKPIENPPLLSEAADGEDGAPAPQTRSAISSD